MPAPKGNKYAAKPASERLSRMGRITCDLGDAMKDDVHRAAEAAGDTLTAWVCDAIQQRLDRDERAATRRSVRNQGSAPSTLPINSSWTLTVSRRVRNQGSAPSTNSAEERKQPNEN